MVNDKTVGLIKARLILAQRLLEESDSLKGYAGYEGSGSKRFHPRHEREALVIYLLLTCFDLLGQRKKQKYREFDEWLISDKCVSEREGILANFSGAEGDHVGTAKALYLGYKELYGVGNSFRNGIISLEQDIKEKFLKSVEVTFCPDHGIYGPETITTGYEIEDKAEELDLRLKRIYRMRNKFTHNLAQYHRASMPRPTHSIFPIDSIALVDGSAWGACIEGGELYYYSSYYETEKLQPVGHVRQYWFFSWPFILFETLYSSIGISFDRSDINLKFYVVISNDNNQYRELHGIPHKLLKPLRDYVRSVNDLGIGFENIVNDLTRTQLR